MMCALLVHGLLCQVCRMHSIISVLLLLISDSQYWWLVTSGSQLDSVAFEYNFCELLCALCACEFHKNLRGEHHMRGSVQLWVRWSLSFTVSCCMSQHVSTSCFVASTVQHEQRCINGAAPASNMYISKFQPASMHAHHRFVSCDWAVTTFHHAASRHQKQRMELQCVVLMVLFSVVAENGNIARTARISYCQGDLEASCPYRSMPQNWSPESIRSEPGTWLTSEWTLSSVRLLSAPAIGIADAPRGSRNHWGCFTFQIFIRGLAWSLWNSSCWLPDGSLLLSNSSCCSCCTCTSATAKPQVTRQRRAEHFQGGLPAWADALPEEQSM